MKTLSYPYTVSNLGKYMKEKKFLTVGKYNDKTTALKISVL